MLVAQSENASCTPMDCPSRPSLREVQLSHLRGRDRDTAASCHSVRFRIAGRVDLTSLQQRFERLTGLYRQNHGNNSEGPALPKVWVEHVSAPSSSALSERRRNTEMARSVNPSSGTPCRALLLQYQDWTADLILVAHRAVLDRQMLLGLAGALLEDSLEAVCQHFDGPSAPPTANVDRELYLQQLCAGNYSLKSDWGMGNDRDTAIQTLHHQAAFEESIGPASLASAVALVLSRYNGQAAPVLACLTAAPNVNEYATGANSGFTLVPFAFSPALTCGELLQKTMQTLSNPPAWYTSELAEELAPACENRGEILAGVLFDCGDGKAAGVGPAEYLPCLSPPFPLTIACTAQPKGGWRLTALFPRKNFAESVIAQFVNAVVRVHHILQSRPEVRVSAIGLLDRSDEEQIAVLGRSVGGPHVPDERIEQAFSRVAAHAPTAIAVSCGEDRLTYFELDDHSTRIGQALRHSGVSIGDRVGVCMERSLELVEVLLGILKAGAAYVPMDPLYPAERTAYTINDAQINIVLSSAKDLSVGPNVRVLDPRDLLRLVPEGGAVAVDHSTADNTAYIIYTSGSTGRPKGVAVPHRNVVALLAATMADFQLSATDTWTLFHSSAFDFSVWEIWGCLLTGGHLVVVPYWIARNPGEFADLLTKERVTVLNQTPSAFAQLLEIDRCRPLTATLRLIIFGGEQLDARMLLPWFDHHPEFECRVVNMFGITETTVHVTSQTITREHALEASKSVGYALPGWHCYVMDPEGRLLPPGIAGEIYVGGAGVAQGYWDRPELTAQRFVPDPYTGGRLYRSGDRGRLRPDGRLEHLGRLDTQVKIRGFRIELDEVRSVLLEMPGVRAAAVILAHDDPQDPATAKLCAYMVLNGTTVPELRKHLVRILPEYMVPSSLMALPALPLTSNGKLDVRRLPIPERSNQAERTPTPRDCTSSGGLATAMQQIWQSVLGVPVGLDDNFFDLGGNSLYAMRIAAAMHNQGLPELSVRKLYSQQTVRRLTSCLNG